MNPILVLLFFSKFNMPSVTVYCTRRVRNFWLWFDPHIKKLEPHCKVKKKQYHSTVLFSSFIKNGHSAWFDPQVKKLEPHCIVKQTAVSQYSSVE